MMFEIGDSVFIEKLTLSKKSPNKYVIINKKYCEDQLKLYSYYEYLLLDIKNNSKEKIKIWNNIAFTEYKLHKSNTYYDKIYSIYINVILKLNMIDNKIDK